MQVSDALKKGRFTKGNARARGKKGGRPPREVERAYCRATIEQVSLDDWREIVDAAKQKALEGDAKAREWLGKYIIGTRPLEVHNLYVQAPRPLID